MYKKKKIDKFCRPNKVLVQVKIFYHILIHHVKSHKSMDKRFKLCIIWKSHIYRLISS